MQSSLRHSLSKGGIGATPTYQWDNRSVGGAFFVASRAWRVASIVVRLDRTFEPARGPGRPKEREPGETGQEDSLPTPQMVIRKVADGSAIEAGTALHEPLDLDGVLNTAVSMELSRVPAVLNIQSGVALAIDFLGGKPRSVGSVTVSLVPA